MSGRLLIASAAVMYLVVLGCVMWPADAPARGASHVQGEAPPHPSTPAIAGLPYRSVGMQIQRVDWIDKYEKSIDEIADLGADTVLLVVDTRQENGVSSHIYLDMRMTPTPESLTRLIGHAKKRNLRVILMPIVLLDAPRGGEWRGQINPESWPDWWESYRSMISHFAWIAESSGVNVLVIGSELVSTEDKVDEWTKTIKKVREIFHGQLTYSSNWDHYTAVKIWDQLDLVGMNSYWKFGDEKKVPKPSVEQIEKRWQAIQSDLLPFVTKANKPLLFLEVGWCSMANMAYQPWDYTIDEETAPTDTEIQRRLYEGFFKSWHGNPQLGGFSIWEWTPGNGGPSDRGYTPENKPAEKVLREWLAKPWR